MKLRKNYSRLENNLKIKNEEFLLFLPHFILSTGLIGIGTYTSYLGYDVNNNDLIFLGMTLLLPGLIGLSGLINNFKKYTK